MKVKVQTLALHRSLAVVTFRLFFFFFFFVRGTTFNEPSGYAKVIKNRKQSEAHQNLFFHFQCHATETDEDLQLLDPLTPVGHYFFRLGINCGIKQTFCESMYVI